MSFTGKATYSAGATLPEIADDVSDLVAINSPHETPLLDILGDATRVARSTRHEWIEDSLLPNSDAVSAFNSGTSTVTVGHADRFRVGDQVRFSDQAEVALVTAVDAGANTLVVSRAYGGSSSGTIASGQTVYMIGHAALEGDDAAAVRFTSRSRKSNYTQIFTSTVEVSGSELAVRQLGVKDEIDYQKNQRIRELLRDLENSVINGRSPATNQAGTSTVRRTMNGILASVATNVFTPGAGDFPEDTLLTEEQLNLALRNIWKSSSGQVDLIVVGGPEKRSINKFIDSNRRFISDGETFKSTVNVYESDYGICQVALSRWVPFGTVLLLDSSRIEVMPLAGRSFQYKPLGVAGDREAGQIVGEYTLELRNENAHGAITGLTGAS